MRIHTGHVPTAALVLAAVSLTILLGIAPSASAGDVNTSSPPCKQIDSWSDLTSALDAVIIASSAARIDYDSVGGDSAKTTTADSLSVPIRQFHGTNAATGSSNKPPQPPLLLLCPFSITHDGNKNDGYDITVSGLNIVCDKSGGQDSSVGATTTSSDCEIRGTARHFNIKSNNVNFGGIDISGSRHGAVVVEDRVEGTTFLGSEFLDNILEDEDGGAISLQLGSSATLFTKCLFSDNLAMNGGAISGAFATATVHSSTMYFNEAAGNGGGVYMQGGQPYIFSVSHSRFLYNAASYGEGPAIWSDGAPCDSGGNYACNNVDWTNNLPCDGIMTARDEVCEVFDDNCHTPVVDSGGSDGGGANNYVGGGGDGGGDGIGADVNDGEFRDNISSDKTESPTVTPSSVPSISLEPTSYPTASPSVHPSTPPSGSPTSYPTHSPTAQHSGMPSAQPSESPTFAPSTHPSGQPTSLPSASPTTDPSSSPSQAPTAAPTRIPTGQPTGHPTNSPTYLPSPSPSSFPTEVHSNMPSADPSSHPSASPTISHKPSDTPSTSPSVSPTSSPSASPSAIPSASPSTSHSPTRDCRMNEVERARLVSDLIIAETTTTFEDILNDDSPQHMAFHWLMYEDNQYLCPDDEVIQRYVLAVLYFSTNGDSWTHCSAGDVAMDSPCAVGTETNFLADGSECDWYGVTCGGSKTVTKIAFENNNLRGPIPDEISSLTDLVTLSLEKMNLSGTIPSVLGTLAKILSIDLDFNELTGTIPPELKNIDELKLLDLNDNMLSGNVDALVEIDHLLFVQLHNNRLSGTVSERLGELKELRAITMFGNDLKGYIPEGMCDNRVGNGGQLQHLEVDCGGGDDADVSCTCCSKCWTESPTASPTSIPSASPSFEPTPIHSAPPSFSHSPTVRCNMDATERSFFLQAFLEDVSDPVAMVRDGSAQNKAFKWLAEEDELYICPTDNNVVQRYVMALFYFATEGDSWLRCTQEAVTPCARGADTYRWLSGSANECNWSGVDCDESGGVTGIVFDDNGLSGYLPSEISQLQNLEVLKLENGVIAGSLPSTLGSLKSLRELDLDFNSLTGSIPGELADAEQLRVLDLNNNYELTGNINPLTHLINLRFVQLHHTQLTGTIPSSLGDLKDLETLSIYATDMEGVMPRAVCRNRDTLGGNLINLQADCGGSSPEVLCICCSMCFPMRRMTLDTAAVVLIPTAMPVIPPSGS